MGKEAKTNNGVNKILVLHAGEILFIFKFFVYKRMIFSFLIGTFAKM